MKEIIKKFESENFTEHYKARKKNDEFIEAMKEISERGASRAVWDALDYAINCIKKDVPATAYITEDDGWYSFKCPKCEAEFSWHFSDDAYLENYCFDCGQRLTYSLTEGNKA